MKLSPYFDRSEFACQCGCGFDTVDAELLEVLTIVREHFAVPVRVTSAARCLAHNRKIGSTDSSMHTKGRACDIQVQGVSPADVYDYVHGLYPDRYGIGKYDSFTHIDTRSGRARWEG